ncbi:MAG: hypothetical protein CMO44_19195 [Verrucomicrobiales bacterium]|nr:hypothetical protein [Verrucomicrobiales bacterium]
MAQLDRASEGRGGVGSVRAVQSYHGGRGLGPCGARQTEGKPTIAYIPPALTHIIASGCYPAHAELPGIST